MRKKCRNCLCRTCTDVCYCRTCTEKIKECKRYNGFRQLSIFDVEQPRYRKAPRYSWEYYGIAKERYKKLTSDIRSGRYTYLALSAAHAANEMLAPYILLSVKKNRSYDGVEYAEGLGRIPCGRTDFYGYRRYFYHLFDLELRRIGK